MFPLNLKVSVRIKFLLCNILPGLICIWNDMYEIMCKHLWKEHLCALQVFWCALVSWIVCARARAQFRNIVDDRFSQVLAFRSCSAECIQLAQVNINNAMNFLTLLFSSI